MLIAMLILLPVIFAPAPAAQQTPPPASQPAASQPAAAASLADFAWMQGSWQGEIPAGVLEEQWSGPRGGAMMGMFRLVSAEGQTRVLEFEVLREVDGTVEYLFRHFNVKLEPWETGKDPVRLVFEKRDGAKLVFVNPVADAKPRRVIWERKGDDTLAFEVTELRDGKEQRMITGELRRAPAK